QYHVDDRDRSICRQKQADRTMNPHAGDSAARSDSRSGSGTWSDFSAARMQWRTPNTVTSQVEGIPMWILMYVFSYSVSPAATNDRAEWRLLPTVVFQEFSNEERCRAAKWALEGSLRDAGE